MAHNPVLEKTTLSRSWLRSHAEIPIGAAGVLYDGGRYLRTLGPGEPLSLAERSKTLTLYVMDMQPHTAAWSARLPAHDDEDTFPVTINFEYQVADPQYMIEKRVQDTERLLSQKIEPVLRRKVRDEKITLNRYRDAEEVLESAICDEFAWEEIGLQLITADVTINLDAPTRERVRQLQDLERAMQIPQLSEHTTRLPTKEPTYNFDTRVALTYKVVDRKGLPTRTLEEAEAWLWQQVQRALRRESRHYTVEQVDQAEEKMQAAIEEERFSDHGLEVVSTLVEISLDERALDRAQKLIDIHNREQFEKAQASLEDWKQKRQLDHQRDAVSFYSPLIKDGQWSLLAMILSQDPTGAERILTYLDAQRRDILTKQMEIFKTMVDAGGLEGWQMEDQAKAVLQSVLNQTIASPAGPGLPDGLSFKRIESGPATPGTAGGDGGEAKTEAAAGETPAPAPEPPETGSKDTPTDIGEIQEASTGETPAPAPEPPGTGSRDTPPGTDETQE